MSKGRWEEEGECRVTRGLEVREECVGCQGVLGRVGVNAGG